MKERTIDHCHCSLGAAGVVLREGRVLLVRRLFEPFKGRWTLPSGYVEKDESIDDAVKREVLEETGVYTEVVGVVGVRNRVSPGDNNLLIAFRLIPLSGEAAPDGVEVDRAEFIPIEEALASDEVIPITRLVLRGVVDHPEFALMEQECPPPPGLTVDSYRAWAAGITPRPAEI